MRVADFNVERVRRGPAETDAPLIVDSDAVPAAAAAAQQFQPIGRWNQKRLEPGCCVVGATT
jgi:hypothetical protein